MDWLNTTITAILSLPAGALGLFIFNLWKERNTHQLSSDAQKNEAELKINDQAVKIYKEFTEQFKKDFDKLEDDYFIIKEELIKVKVERDHLLKVLEQNKGV